MKFALTSICLEFPLKQDILLQRGKKLISESSVSCHIVFRLEGINELNTLLSRDLSINIIKFQLYIANLTQGMPVVVHVFV